MQSELAEAQGVGRILVATDFSKGAERALAAGIELAQAFHATIDLLHVYPPVSGVFPGAPTPVNVENIERALAELAERVRNAGVECRTASVEGAAAEMINSQTASLAGDLIVMGTQGRTGLRRLMLGSVAEETLRGAVTPVLVVPSEDADAPAVGPAPAETSS
jgi:nucleotide-binding universal stress UspA family protein